MTTFFVTRHPGAVEWAARQSIKSRIIAHLDPAAISPGDRVLGTLPVHIAAEIRARGGRYYHLTLDLPEHMRGRELSADDMELCGARLTPYRVEKDDSE